MINQIQQYYKLVEETMNAPLTPDRTGDGRHRVFNRQMVFDLSSLELPVTTRRKIFHKAALRELVWMIRGCGITHIPTDGTSVYPAKASVLEEMGSGIWKEWTLRKEDVKSYLAKYHNEELWNNDEVIDYFCSRLEDTIGPMYGSLWRHIQSERGTEVRQAKDIDLNDIASDRMEVIKRLYEETKKMSDEYALNKSKNITQHLVPFEEFAANVAFSYIDPLGDLVSNLKKDPFSSRHVVSVWDPRYLPDVGYSPKENVVRGKGALAPCHFAFQCFVEPSKDNEPHILNLKVHQRSADIILGVPTNLIFYSALLRLLAHTSGFQVGKLVWDAGDVHIYHTHMETAKELLKGKDYPAPTLTINEKLTDFFKVQVEDLVVSDYNTGPKLEFPRSV